MPTRQATRVTLPEDKTEMKNEKYGQALRARRESTGLTQAELAQVIGANRATIGSAEKGASISNRTHYNVLCALGCEPNMAVWENFDDPNLIPVLTTRVAGIGARAVLALNPTTRFPIAAGYFELVAEASRRKFPTDGFRICEELVGQMSDTDAETFDQELAVLLGELYPIRWFDGRRHGLRAESHTTGATAAVRHYGATDGSGDLQHVQLISEGLTGVAGAAQLMMQGVTAGVPQSAITEILQSGLAYAEQEKVIRYAIGRAEQMRDQLERDVRLILDLTDGAPPSPSR